MKTYFAKSRMGAVALLFAVLLTPVLSHAAVNKVVVGGITPGYPGVVQYTVNYMDGGTHIETSGEIANIGTSTTQGQIIQSIRDEVTQYAIGAGYPVTGNDIIWANATQKDIDTAIAAATSTLNLPQAMSFASTSRSLNSNYTVSSTRAAMVSYSINAAWTATALLGGSGTAFLEYSTNGGTTWNTVNQVSKSLNLLTFTGSDDMNLMGFVPANATVRVRTTTSNMTLTYVRGQEVLLSSN